MQYYSGLFHLYVAVKLFYQEPIILLHSQVVDRDTERESWASGRVALPKRT